MNVGDKSLISRIRLGDTEAFKELFYLYSGRLCSWAYKITNDRHIAEDIVQDFFIKYWEKKEILEFNPSFLSYAYRAVYNSSLNYVRDNEKYIYGYELTLLNISEKEFAKDEDQELQKVLMKAVDELPDKCKRIFIESTFKKRKYAEIAEEYGISVNTVKVQVSKAYRLLREKIDPATLLFIILFSNISVFTSA